MGSVQPIVYLTGSIRHGCPWLEGQRGLNVRPDWPGRNLAGTFRSYLVHTRQVDRQDRDITIQGKYGHAMLESRHVS